MGSSGPFSGLVSPCLLASPALGDLLHFTWKEPMPVTCPLLVAVTHKCVTVLGIRDVSSMKTVLAILDQQLCRAESLFPGSITDVVFVDYGLIFIFRLRLEESKDILFVVPCLFTPGTIPC